MQSKVFRDTINMASLWDWYRLMSYVPFILITLHIQLHKSLHILCKCNKKCNVLLQQNELYFFPILKQNGFCLMQLTFVNFKYLRLNCWCFSLFFFLIIVLQLLPGILQPCYKSLPSVIILFIIININNQCYKLVNLYLQSVEV